MEGIRILQCVGQLDRGGIETMLMELYRHIDRSKVQFDFVTHGDNPGVFEEEIKALGGTIYRAPAYSPRTHFRYKSAFVRLFKENPGRWKAMHGHMFTTSGIYLAIAKKYGLIAVAHSHTASHRSSLRNHLKYLYYLRIRYIADRFLACSEAAGKYLFGAKVYHSDRFAVLKNAIDAEKFAFSAQRRDKIRAAMSLTNRLVIGHIGRFHYPKNHNFVIDIFDQVHRAREDAVLLLVGDGELKKSMEEKVRSLGLENSIRFLGVREDIPDLLRAMDVFVFPSRYEGLGIALVEAQAMGLRCVYSDSIPKEAVITDLTEALPLSAGTRVWAEKIWEKQGARRDQTECIRKAGYDVTENAAWLQQFYLKF